MEDNLKIYKVEYISNHWSDLTQILDLSLGYKTKLYKCFKSRRPQTEDDLKVEYLRNYWSDLTQICDLRVGYQTKLSKCFKLWQPQKKNDIKIYKVEYQSNHFSDLPKFET